MRQVRRRLGIPGVDRVLATFWVWIDAIAGVR
jgi:hypothetical protein